MTTFITACKRSLGQGNIFTTVCHSVHGGCLVPGGSGPVGAPGSWGVPGPEAGMPGHRGGGAWSREVCLVETPHPDGYCCGRYAL